MAIKQKKEIITEEAIEIPSEEAEMDVEIESEYSEYAPDNEEIGENNQNTKRLKKKKIYKQAKKGGSKSL